MRIVKESDERKQEILDASIRVFSRKGYDKTSISDIAKEIGISQGLCYRYFPSKEAIYDACIEQYAESIVAQNKKRAHLEELNLREQILQMSGKMQEYAGTESGQENLYELFHREGNHRLHNELFLKVAQKLIPYITNTLEAAKERGETDIADPHATAYFFVYGQVGILMSEDFSEEEKTNKIQQCIFELLRL